MRAGDDRGQAYTIEGIIGAIVVVSALVLGLQAVDIAPWTDDSTERQTESLRVQIQDVLDAANDRDALRTAATCIDGDGTPRPHPAVAAGGAANNTERAVFGTLLNRTLDENNQRYSVYLDYPNGTELNTTAITQDQDVTRSSVTVTRQIPLFDSDPVLEFDSDAGECVTVQSPSNPAESETLGERNRTAPDTIYLDNQDDDSELYAVVKIRVVAW